MSKLIELIKNFVDAQNKIMVAIPGEGYALARVESVVDDVVTLVPDGKPKVVLHYTQFIVRT